MATIEIAFGIGIALGSTALLRHMNQRLGRFETLVIGNAMLGIGLLAAAFCNTVYATIPCLLMCGAGFALFNINASTLRLVATPHGFLSRMVAGVAFLSSFLNPFATQGLGYLMEFFGFKVSIGICGIMALLSTLILLRNRDAKALLRRPTEDIIGIYATLYPKAFSSSRNA